MDKRDDLFYPERINEQVEHLARIQDLQQQDSTPGAPTIAALQSIYKEDEAMLENAWTRLTRLASATRPSGNTNQPVWRQADRGKNNMHETELSPETGGQVMPSTPTMRAPERPRHSHQRHWRMISLLAAILTAVVIASSMIWVINAGQPRTTSIGAPTKAPLPPSFAVYVGSENGLIRVDARTGKIVWGYHFPASNTSDAQSAFSQILPAGKVVYGLTTPSVSATQVIAFNAKNGQVLWSRTAPEATNMVLERDTLYIGINATDPNTNKSSITTLNASTGTPLATKYTLSGFSPKLSLVNGVLYAVTDTQLTAIDLAHNQLVWQKNATELISGSNYVSVEGFSATRQAVYATFQTVNGVSCMALKASNGSKLWQTDPIAVKGASGGGAGITAPVTNDTTVYFATFGYTSTVFAYDAQKGTQIWQNKIHAIIQQTPVFSGNTLYIARDIVGTGAPNTSFVALNAATGKLIWQTGEKPGVGLLGFAFNGVVYLATAYAKTTSIIYALSVYTGTTIWQAPLGKNPTALAGGKIN